MNIFDWLPAPPWLGPPLPLFLRIYWPWATDRTRVDFFRGSFNFVSGTQFEEPGAIQNDSQPAVEIEWNDDGYPMIIKQLARGKS